ncbi:IclR family transcriptional regulator [Microbacterium sp. G2-8]|uniref:IclR family transcriptional regulator n=1 Tax=Microbacterium sp. G2-8 TaxID=2842454 RepID=UPI001C89AF42|nr:helix-turn-helix domain-containing protein [Microbacterium sp. G2-8]
MAQAGTSGSQTLDRGVRILETIAAASHPMSIDELAGALEVHRSVAYRLLRTLEDHDLVSRDGSGLVRLGAGLAALAYGASRDLNQAAYPELVAVADDLGMTCLIAVLLDGDDAVTLMSASPRSGIGVSYRPGHRHPITRGGPGKAILMGLPRVSWPADLDDDLRRELDESLARGYATSAHEVVPSLHAVSVPLPLPGQPPASLAVVHVSLPRAADEIAARLTRAARIIAASFGG